MKTFNRRVMLRGLGGAAVAAPFLPSVVESEAKAQGMTATSPKRLIVFYTHYGCLTSRWFPKLSHGKLASADYSALTTLKPMAPYADKLLMVRGVRSMNEWSNGGTYGQKNDPHTQVQGSYFTCHPVTPNADSGFDTSDPSGVSPKTAAKPTGRSLDHVCAEQVNPSGGAPLYVEIGGASGNATNTMHLLSWDAPGSFFAGVTSPMQIYNNLTKLFGTGSMNADTYRVSRGKSIIDCVRDDLTRYKGMKMSGADQKRLNDWTELLHYTTGAATGGAQCSMSVATDPMGLNLTSTRLTEASMLGTKIDIDKTVKTFMDLSALTAMCDSNRVIFLKMPGNFTFRNLGLSLESHSVSHRTGNANQGGTCVSNALDMVHTIDKYYAELFAYFVGRLDGISEGDGKTLLDNTATVWFQEMSDGNSHNLNNLPILQAGSCGGYFKTGQAINVDGAKTDMTQGGSDMDCMNGESPSNKLDTLGTAPDIASKPINKYFCNLMNAIGVKAGADGFPVKGGTNPVTKYGKYDDTKMFSDGGSKPATIANPGEYMELRA
jgi:hypothetical protein